MARGTISEEGGETAVRDRLAVLEQRPRSELEALSELSSEEATVEGQPVTITTYPEKHDSGELRVIVQLSTQSVPLLKVFATRQVFAQGFELKADGTIRQLREDELYDYT